MSIKLEITDNPPITLEEILENLFWKQPEVAKYAKDFLQNIKEWSRTETPYTVDQWKQYTLRHNITQSTYHNMLKRLRRAGMIVKVYNQGSKKHELQLNKQFADVLYSLYSIWNEYLKS